MCGICGEGSMQSLTVGLWVRHCDLCSQWEASHPARVGVSLSWKPAERGPHTQLPASPWVYTPGGPAPAPAPQALCTLGVAVSACLFLQTSSVPCSLSPAFSQAETASEGVCRPAILFLVVLQIDSRASALDTSPALSFLIFN